MGWTWLGRTTEEQMEANEAEVEALHAQWSALTTEIERERFDAEAERERGWDYEPTDDDEAEDPGLTVRLRAQVAMRDAARERQVQTLADMMKERGARVMRPYEHWNEDERFMEWSERDR